MNALQRRDGFARITVAQGESRVSTDPEVVLTTILGSCVAACLFDPVAHVGGLNHYLLAEGGDAADPGSMQRYGLYAMEVLINAMLAKGAARSRLRARIYGGATMRTGFKDIGGDNIRFARAFLRDERIALVAEDVGGTGARRVEFRAALGLARSKVVGEAAIQAARPAPAGPQPTRTPTRTPARPPAPASVGDVEFF